MADVETLARGDDSRLVEARRFLIRDRPAFAAVWAAHAGQDAVAPAVDFHKRMVAAVFAGECPTAGYAIEVTGMTREGSELVVIVEEHRPDPSRVAAQIVLSPFHIVTLPRDDGAVRFNLPDPGGHHTIIFKPARPSAAARASTSTFPTSGDGVSPFTGLTPRVAGSLAYAAGPLSGALLLATERENRFVRFHAWQAVIGLGLLGVAAIGALALAFAFLVVSPVAFWTFLWLAAAGGAAWVTLWVLCLMNAYKGRQWKLPFAGDYADRHAGMGAGASTSLRAI